jgi:hypothetical protein
MPVEREVGTMRTPDQVMGSLIGFTAGALTAGAVIGTGAAMSAGVRGAARRAGARRARALAGLASPIVLGDRGNLEHGLPLQEKGYMWGEKAKRRVSRRSPWWTWFALPVALALAVVVAVLAAGAGIPARTEQAEQWITVVNKAFLLFMAVAAACFPIALHKAGRRGINLFINDVVRSKIPDYWRAREMVRAEMAAGRMFRDEALYRLGSTWLGGYYAATPATPMTWPMNARPTGTGQPNPFAR